MKYWLLAFLVGSFLISGCSSINVYDNVQINTPRDVELPLDSEKDAIAYSVTLELVNAELNNPSASMVREGKFYWHARAFLYDSRLGKDPQTGEVVKYQDVWGITWFEGKQGCESSKGCAMLIQKDGAVISPLHCSTGWNCE